MCILTIDEARAYFSLPADGSGDGALGLIVPAVNDFIEKQTGRTFTGGTFTEYLDGRDSDRIGVKSPPITSVTSVAIVNAAQTVQYTYDSTLYNFDADVGTIYLAPSTETWLYDDTNGTSVWDRQANSPRFPKGIRNIKVVYVGGYAGAIPASFKLAAAKLAAIELAMKDDPTVTSETTGQRSITRGGLSQPGALSQQVNDILAPLMRY